MSFDFARLTHQCSMQLSISPDKLVADAATDEMTANSISAASTENVSHIGNLRCPPPLPLSDECICICIIISVQRTLDVRCNVLNFNA